MTTASATPAVVPARTSLLGRAPTAPPGPVPFGRLVDVELRKTVDTRAGFWLLVAVALLVVTSAASEFLEPSASWTYRSFLEMTARAVAISAPMLAALAVTGEWSQRAALTTFALTPRRGRVLGAKAVGVAGVGATIVVVAFAAAGLSALLATTAGGVDHVWDVSFGEQLRLVLHLAISLAVGFMLGVVLRHTSAALVGYLLFALVLPLLTSTLAAGQDWIVDTAPWVDLSTSLQALLGPAALTGEQWAQLGTTAALWLVIPLTLGMRRLLRVEIR